MEELLSDIASHSTTRVIKKGATLLYQSEIPHSAFIVRKGIIRAYTVTSSGEERIAALHARNDIFPLSWIYGGTPNTLFYYEALVDSQVVCVPKAALTEAVTSKPALLQIIFRFAINEYTALLLRVTALEQSSAAEKIAMTLYYLLIRHGIERTPGEFTIQLKMTQSMIASLVGLTRESTAVNLKLLQRKHIIHYSNFTYVVNKPNLERFIGEDSFKDVTLRS